MTNLSDDDILSHLRQFLGTWTTEAVSYIASDPSELLAALPEERWRFEGSYYVRNSEVTYVLKPGAQEVLQELPSYKALDDAANASPVIAPMLGKLVGTPRMRGLFTTWTLASAFIPDFNDIVHERSYSFEERYQNVFEQLTQQEMEYQVTCPLQGVSFQKTVELASGLLIERLTSEEIVDALLTGVLSSRGPTWPAFNIGEGESFALKKISSLPLLVMAPDGSDKDLTHGQELSSVSNASEEVDQLLQCLALMTHRNISVSGSMFKSTKRYFLIDDSAIMSGLMPARPYFEWNPFQLGQDKCEELKRIWTLSHDESFPQNKALALALRRLAFATQRTRPEDRLLDIFIAGEALYLTDAGDTKDRGELKYRLALRAAVWSEDTLPGWTRKEVFDQMKRGYELRSTVAHGGVPKSKDIKVKGESVGFSDLVQATEEIIRSALYKALKQLPGAGQRLSIPWDDLVLGN